MLDALYEALAVFAALPLFAAFTRSHRLLRDLARPSRCNVLAALYEALAVLRFYRCSPSLRRHDTRDMTGFPGDSTQEEVRGKNVLSTPRLCITSALNPRHSDRSKDNTHGPVAVVPEGRRTWMPHDTSFGVTRPAISDDLFGLTPISSYL